MNYARSMSIVSAEGRVLVEIELRFPDQVTKSGIYLQKEKKQGVPTTGIVYAVGKGVAGLEIGERIVFHEPKPHVIEHEGKDLLSLKKDQIIAKIG